MVMCPPPTNPPPIPIRHTYTSIKRVSRTSLHTQKIINNTIQNLRDRNVYGEHKAVKRDRVFFIFWLERVCLHLKRLDFVVNVGKQIAARLNPELDTRTSGKIGTNGEVVHDAPSTVDFQKDQQSRTQKHIIYTNTESFVVGWFFVFF